MLIIGIESHLLPATTCNEAMFLDNTTSLWAVAVVLKHTTSPAINSLMGMLDNISVKINIDYKSTETLKFN